MASSRTGFTVQTNGQTLIVSVTAVGAASTTMYSNAACTAAVTFPDVISSDKTYYVKPPAFGRYTVSVKQPDGTEIWGRVVDCEPSDGIAALAPLPTQAQLAVDSQFRTQQFISGQYYQAANASALTTSALTLSQLRLSPWYVPAPLTLDKIGAEVTTTGASTSVVRLGIYADNGYGYPGSLVLDAGTIDGTSQTVQDIDLDPDVTLSPGLYWWGGVSQAVTCTVRVLNAAPLTGPHPLGTTTPAATAVACYVEAAVTGALNATFTTTKTVLAAAAPRIHFKVA